VELAILAGAILAVIALIVAAGRVEDAHQSVAHAAEDAARAATQARTWPAADSAARTTADADLTGKLTCTPLHLSLTGQMTPGATVTANLTCTTALGIFPGHLAVTETATAVIDQYRGVTR
jgi:Flp pilus assembly protein TadG